MARNISNFLKNFKESCNFDVPTYSDEDRLNLLSIDDVAKENIKKLTFEKVNFDDSDCYKDNNYGVIKLDDLIGINRQDNVNNWLELLFSLHRTKNFSIYHNRDNFSRYVDSLNDNDIDLPHVLDIQGKYFIFHGGKHRLTIAKCIGLETFPVLIKKLKN